MGVGTPVDLLTAMAAGVDMFDCVLPTRNARNGLLFTSCGRLIIRNAVYARDDGPVGREVRLLHLPDLSRAYLRHLFRSPASCWPCGSTRSTTCTTSWV